MWKAVLLSLATFVIGVPLVAAILWFPVILLAGPHSSILPSAIQSLVLLGGLASVAVVPAWLALKVYRRARSWHVPKTGAA